MIELMKNWGNTPFPDMIRDLPEIEIALEGIRGWLLENDNKQVVFFDIAPVGILPPHSHCSQWGIVLEGKMRLTIGEETKLYEKGDWYFIPEGVVHSAEFLTQVHAIDVFDAPDRYQKKL